ncbi:winged helix-turn-helix transcriptional regulator [Haloglomus salinum]|uniref:winged helix-turn-helix transcriptional regulator n=1 Tax=Haloglomus salinum TaxID=2962673 RepID=UPI0020C94711|nr:helix-turn-helix domain-containing protein [Haloglomus salinum]
MTAETDARQEEIRASNESACPVVHAIDQVGTPWRLNILHALQDGEQRFNELKRATNARSKTLSDALDGLAEADIVERRMEEAAPVAVYYSLTAKGGALTDALSDLGDWAEEWADVPTAERPAVRGPTQH